MTVRIEPWGDGDRPLLEALLGDPAMTQHLGGPESPAQLDSRQKRYEQPGSGMFRIVIEESGEAVGSVGFWPKEWRGEQVYESGWSVLPQFQGRGIAGQATSLVLAAAAAEGDRRFVHAFPSVQNAASNALCRKLGFTDLGECEFEYPPGSLMRCTDWRFDLRG